MQIVCLGLLLFCLTWAEPTVQPQTEKTKQDCVEEHRITYKGHHEKHGDYSFKYVYTSSGRKNQTNMKQEEKDKDNTVLHHSGKRRTQEPPSEENIVQEREKDLFLLGFNENDQISKPPNLFENRQTMNEDDSIKNNENARSNLKVPTHPESPGHSGPEGGDNVVSELHGRVEEGAALNRNNMRHIMEPEAVIKLLGEENKEIKPRNIESKNPASVHYAKDLSKSKKNYQREPQAPNIPVKSKSTHHIHHKTDYLKQFPQIKNIPSDFGGSGYPDVQERGDNDILPFSGDGEPFKDISAKGEAIDPDLEGADTQTEFSGPGEAETINPEAGGPGYNDIPEKSGSGRNALGGRDEIGQEAGTGGVSLVGGSNDIIGSTNFKELPGKEGNRVDTGGQNAHQGKVEFHYPPAPPKEKRKEGSSDVAVSTNHNEIPKNGKGSSRKGTEHSNRNQVTSNENQRFPSKGKSPGRLIPSHDLDNEIGSQSGPSNEKTMTTHSGKNQYAAHRQRNSTWNKGAPQRKGSWGYRQTYAHRRSRPPKNHDSSDSSDSSSESDGD